MKRKNSIVAVCAILLVFMIANTKAETWYVEKSGLDSNSGKSREQAFLSVSKGAEMLKNPGDILIVGPGVYYESLKINARGVKGKPVTVKARIPGLTELRGAEYVSKWTKAPGYKNVYFTNREQISYQLWEMDSARLMREVANLKILEESPGTFYNDEINKRVYLHTFDSGSPKRHHYELSVRDVGISGIAPKPAWNHSVRNEWLVIDGFYTRGYNLSGIYIQNFDNSILRDSTVSHSRRGITIAGAYRSQLLRNEGYLTKDPNMREAGSILVCGYVIDTLIDDCVAHHAKQHGIRFYGGLYGNIMRNCLLYKCRIGIQIKGFEFGNKRALRVLRNSEGGKAVLTPGRRVVSTDNMLNQPGTNYNYVINPYVKTTNNTVVGLYRYAGKDNNKSDLRYLLNKGNKAGFAAPAWHDLRLSSDSPEWQKKVGATRPGKCFFVNPENGNDDNSGDGASRAWKTLKAAVSKLKPGVTLYLMNGSFPVLDLKNVHGTKDNPIVIRCRKRDYSCTVKGININNSSNIEIAGLRVSASENAGVNMSGCENIQIKENWIYNNQGAGIAGQGDKIRIENNVVTRNRLSPLDLKGDSLLVINNNLRSNGKHLPASLGKNPAIWFAYNNVDLLDSLRKNIASHQRSGNVSYKSDFVDPVKADYKLKSKSRLNGIGFRGYSIGSARLPEAHSPKRTIKDVKVVQTTPTAAYLRWRISGAKACIALKWGTDPKHLDKTIILNNGNYYFHKQYFALRNLKPGSKYYFRPGYNVLKGQQKPYHAYNYTWPANGINKEIKYYKSLPKTTVYSQKVYSFNTPEYMPDHKAKIIHVAKNGHPNGKGTSDDPVNTIMGASKLAMPGDTVRVRKGTYREQVEPVRSGVKGRPISYEAAPGERVIINGSRELLINGFFVSWRDYINIRGFVFCEQRERPEEIRGGGMINMQEAENISVENCLIDGRMNMIHNICTYRTKNIIIRNNLISSSSLALRLVDGKGYTIVDHNSFYGATMYKVFAVRNSDLTVSNNIFYEQLFPKKSFLPKQKISNNIKYVSDYNCYYFVPSNKVMNLSQIAIISEPLPWEGTDEAIAKERRIAKSARHIKAAKSLEKLHAENLDKNSIIVTDIKLAYPDKIRRFRSRFRGWPDRFHKFMPMYRKDFKLKADSPTVKAGANGSNIGADWSY